MIQAYDKLGSAVAGGVAIALMENLKPPHGAKVLAIAEVADLAGAVVGCVLESRGGRLGQFGQGLTNGAITLSMLAAYCLYRAGELM